MDLRGRYLIERLELRYVNTGRELLRDTSSPAPGAPVLVGDPDYGPVAPDGRLGLAFLPLPETATEVRAVAKRLGDRLGTPQLIDGARATEASVTSLHRPVILHLATHGFFVPASRVFAPTGAPRRDERAAKVTTLPFASGAIEAQLRSALALAGANHPAEETDGLLTAYEAATLDLEGTKLVVMSGCETGIGEVQGGEGVLGLRRAFALAGAETAVMSLWKVSDESTRALMVRYYDGLLAGRGRAEALRDAQLALAREPATAHPYHWAGFILSGDGGPIIARPAPPPEAPRAGGCACRMALPRGTDAPTTMWLGLLLALAVRRRRRRTPAGVATTWRRGWHGGLSSSDAEGSASRGMFAYREA
jgi:CHAT domain-containing protein